MEKWSKVWNEKWGDLTEKEKELLEKHKLLYEELFKEEDVDKRDIIWEKIQEVKKQLREIYAEFFKKTLGIK